MTPYNDYHNSGWKVGFAAGFGIEHAIRQNITIKGEYLFIGLPSDTVQSQYGIDNDYVPGTFESSVHMIRLGANIKFGEGGPLANSGRAWAYDPSSYNWTGIYAGAVAGGGLYTGSSINSYYSDYYQVAASDWGAVAGATLGANLQRGPFVVGVEGDINWSGLGYEPFDTYYGGGYYETRSEWDYFATLRARAGLAVGNTMAYATGGLAFVKVDQEWCYYSGECGTSEYDYINKGWRTGFAAGAGIEHALRDNITIKGEYMYIGLPSKFIHNEEYPASGGYNPGSFESSAQLFRVGINVRTSDSRLKRDIRPVGRLPNGLTLYAYKYLWCETVYVGVMAQEVLQVDPLAVVTRPGGYLAVDYGRLGTRLMTYAEFLCSGERSAERRLAA